MNYDFTKVQQRLDEGLTLQELVAQIKEKTGEEIDLTTISKALKRGTASKRTGRALSKTLRIPMTELLGRSA